MCTRRQKIRELEYQFRRYHIQIVSILLILRARTEKRERKCHELIQEHDLKRKTHNTFCASIDINRVTSKHHHEIPEYLRQK